MIAGGPDADTIVVPRRAKRNFDMVQDFSAFACTIGGGKDAAAWIGTGPAVLEAHTAGVAAHRATIARRLRDPAEAGLFAPLARQPGSFASDLEASSSLSRPTHATGRC